MARPLAALPRVTGTDPTVFVVGAPRSGTTWVQSILRRADSVVSGPESHAFDVLYAPLRAKRHSVRRPGRRQRTLAAFDERAGAAAERYGDQGPHQWIDRAELEALLDDCDRTRLRGDAAASHVLGGVFAAGRRHFGAAPGDVLVEKTPRHVHFAEQILRWWPDAKVVEVIRDGRDVSVSLDHKAQRHTWAAAEREVQIGWWSQAVRRGAEVRALPVATGRWLTVRYEDLHADRVGQIGRLFEFVGVSATPEVLAEVSASTSIDKARLLGSDHVRRGATGDWRTHLSDDDKALFEREAGDLLRSLGYPRD